MKKILLFCLLPLIGFSQTKTTVDLDKKYDGLSLYFYKNTLRMLNQKDDKEFDELIKDIEKMPIKKELPGREIRRGNVRTI
jgi:hypothetical protein